MKTRLWPRLLRVALPCLVLGVVPSASAAAGGQDLPHGRVIEKVTCANDATQSYALYLPSRYSPDRKWPILYAFDPGARGLLPVQHFMDAAERYGYIVVGSHNSQNGPAAVSHEAMRAVFNDTTSRFSVDPGRIYLTGFSGGARFAVMAAQVLGERAAGVIGCGAGFPVGVQPSASTTFAYYGTAGTDDFNFPEMKQLDEALGKLGLPHRLDVFEGGHDWPPAPVCLRAIEWMEIQAMKSKARPRDEAVLDAMLAGAAAAAASDEKAGRTYQAYLRYAAMASDFAGLRDVTAYDQKTRQLASSREVREAQAEESNSIPRQMSAQAQISRLTDMVLTGEDVGSALPDLLAALATLRTQSERPKNDASRMAARRVLESSWGQLNQAAGQEMEAGEYGRVIARLGVMARIRPDSARVDYALARAYARSGKKGPAIQALKSAVKKGFTDVAALEAEPAFELLHAEDGYRDIVAGLRKQAGLRPPVF